MNIQNGQIHLYSLEHFMTDRCNLRCQHCAASSPFLSDANLPALETFATALSHLAKMMHCDQLKFVGGEPLLNKDLCTFMQVARESRMFDRIRVTTNGILLPRMSDEFWRLADIVEISLYPGVRNAPAEADLASLQQLAAAFSTRLEVHPIHQFMYAISDTRNNNPDLVNQIFSSCGEAHTWSCHLLYRNHLYRCSRVHTLDRYLSELGIEHENFTAEDGLLIDNRDTLFQDIVDYLKSPVPLSACSFCLGTSGVWIEHRQLAIEEIRSKKAGELVPFNKNALVSTYEARFRNLIRTWSEAETLKR